MVGINELAERVAAEREAWPGRRWRCSRGLRAAIVDAAAALVRSGWSVTRIAKKVGVTPMTLRRWSRGWCGEGASRPGFRPVEIGAVSARRRELTLVSPSGYRVEGLELQEVERLLAALR